MAKNYENENKTSNYSTDKATSKNASLNKTSNAYNKEQDDYSDRY